MNLAARFKHSTDTPRNLYAAAYQAATPSAAAPE